MKSILHPRWALVAIFLCAAATNRTGSLAESAAGRDARIISSPKVKVAAREGKSVRGTIEHLPFVLLRGTVVERGEAYGAFAGKEVRALLEEVLVPVINAKDKQGWAKLGAVAEAKFRFPDEMLSQMNSFLRGFARTAPAAERRMKSLDREMNLTDLKIFQVFADLASSGAIHFGGCSSFAAWGKLTADGEVIAGRNLDYTTFPGRMPFMIVAQEPAEPGRLKTLEISLAGVFGASTALNEQGVFLSLHDEPGLPARAQGGWTPRIVPLREAIETAHATNAVEAVLRKLRGTPLVMGANLPLSFPLSTGQTPVVIEWDGNEEGGGVTTRTAKNGAAPAVFCTNHYLERGEGRKRVDGSSAERYAALADAAAERFKNSAAIDLPTAARMMSKAAVRGPVSTYISVVARPAERRVLVAFAAEPGASATDSAWVDVRWDQIFSAK